MSAVLQATGVAVRFGGVHALAGIDLEVQEGQLVGLIGPNGAGKTTFVDAITGFVPYTGRIALDGRDLAGIPPHGRARAGLARTWQSTELFDDLSVRENLSVAAHRPARRNGRRRGRTVAETAPAVDESLALVDLDWAAQLMPSDLSQGERKLVGVARAIAMRPRLLCLDEPAAGLDTNESEELGRRLRRLADGGTTMLLIDHDMDLVLSICDHIFVLQFGELIAAGPPDAVRRDPRVITAYLGAGDRQQLLDDDSDDGSDGSGGGGDDGAGGLT
jgi:branched-chain amino acid transport system ATP-binding protein